MRGVTAKFGDGWSYWVHNQEAEGDKCYSSTCCLLFTVRHPNLGDGACHIQAGSSFLKETSLEAASQTDTPVIYLLHASLSSHIIDEH